MKELAAATILQGDALQTLRAMPPESVHLCVTSPPYYALRDYGTGRWEGGDPACSHAKVLDPAAAVATSTLDGGKKSTGHLQEGFGKTCRRCGARRVDQQIGLEPTLAEYLARLVEVFGEVRRVLRRDGLLFVNIGDSYVSSGSDGNQRKRPELTGGGLSTWSTRDVKRGSSLGVGLPAKCLLGVPWRLAFALIDDGWILRSEIIYSKANPLPESVRDRPTKSHEQLFMFSRSQRYYWDGDAVREDAVYGRREWRNGCNYGYAGDATDAPKRKCAVTTGKGDPSAGRNLRSVWTIPCEPSPFAHFASYPKKLVEPCVLAGTSERGVCGECGAPWRRIVEVSGGTIGEAWHDHSDDMGRGQRSGASGAGMKTYRRESKGWQPTCACAADPVPATVLDCFAGTATTGVVALKHGRRFVGIELSPDYVAIAWQRLARWHDEADGDEKPEAVKGQPGLPF